MKVKNENYTPRERINREMLDRMLAEEARRDACEINPPAPIASYPCAATANPCPPCIRNTPSQTRAKADCMTDRRDTAGTPAGVCRTPVYPGVSLAMVYSPCQAFDDLYDVDAALSHGTIFKELDKPFYPTPCNERWCNA